ncbi:RPS7, partial [Symbiodinium sp. KB8]
LDSVTLVRCHAFGDGICRAMEVGTGVQPQKLPPESGTEAAEHGDDPELQEIPMLPKIVAPPTLNSTARWSCDRQRLWILGIAVPIVLFICLCIMVPLVSTTWLALMRLLRQPPCPRNMRHALCNWGRLHRGTSGIQGSLVPSTKNPLWVDPNSTVAHQSMTDLVGILQQSQPEDVHKNLCHLFEEWLPRVGMNGWIDLISGMEQANEQDSGDVWGIDLDELSSELLDISVDWKHDLGAYIIGRLQPHLLVSGRGYLWHAVEVAGSLKLGGAPLHAVTWAAMLAFLEASEWSNASGLWDFAMGHICSAFQQEKMELPGLFVHCIHGFGHGAMLAGIVLGLDAGQRSTYTSRPACERVRNGTSGFELSMQMLNNAMGICRSSQSPQLRYICAGGAFMEFWKTRGKGWTPKYDGDALPKEPIAEVEVAQEWSSPERTQKAVEKRSGEMKTWMFEHSCAFSNLPAACFRFEPGLGVEHQANNFQALADVPLYEPCTQSIWSSGVSWDLEHLRGCILGRSFSLYKHFDLWRYGRVARHLDTAHPSEERLPTLAEWCSMYEPAGLNQSHAQGDIKLKFPLLPGVRSYSNWLACIAGSMAHVAFVVEGEAISDSVVQQHCAQLDDLQGQKLCVDIGLSRHLRNLSDLRIWPIDVLEQEVVHGF